MVTLEVRSLADSLSDAVRGMESGESSGPRIAFERPELLFKLLTVKRWEILRNMQGASPMSIREVARRTRRDVKAVHGDVHALLNAGILDKTENGQVVFPYDAVHVDFVLNVA